MLNVAESRRAWWLVLHVLAVLAFPLAIRAQIVAPAQPEDGGRVGRIRDLLTTAGFADVAAAVSEQVVVVTYANTRYRDPRRALRHVAERVMPELRTGERLVLIPTLAQVPLASATYRPPSPDAPDAPLSADEVALDVPEARLLCGVPRSSTGRGRIDVVIEPWLEASFGNYDNPVATRSGVAPSLQTELLPGLMATVQARVTLQNDLVAGESLVRPGLVTLRRVQRLSGNVFVAATAGLFTGNRHGLDAEATAATNDGRWRLGGSVGRTGASRYRADGWRAERPDETTALLTASHRMPRYDLTIRGTAGMFLGDHRGVRLDIIRRFGEAEIGWFGATSAQGSNGGFSLRIPLLQSRYSTPAPIRVRLGDAFRWEYRYRSGVLGGRAYSATNNDDLEGRWIPFTPAP